MLERLLDLPLKSLVLVLTAIGFAYVILSVLQAILDPLRDIPGPLLARFTKLWYFIEIYKGTFEISNVELHKKHGPVVRIAPNQYSIDDVEAAKTIYGHGNTFNKSRWYWAWMPPDPNKASLFADLNPVRHGIQRRKFSAAYSMTSLVTYEPFVNSCTSLLSQRFSELAASGRPANLGHWLQCYAFDVIGEITFGSRFGFLDMGLDEAGVFEAIDARGRYSSFVGIFPALHALVYPMMPKTGGHGYVANYTISRISARQALLKDPKNADREGPPDFLTKFLEGHEADPEKMTKTDLFTICQSNIGAGSDTTSITLSAIFYYLMKFPATKRRLQEEINDAAKGGRISDPITFKEAQDLPYLQAVIKEGLRMHPATGLPLLRIVPATGATLAGYEFPAGATVGINAWVAHHNTSVYGMDADAWRPERWLEIDEQKRGGDVEKYFFAFGMGSRTCIGKNISLLEISKLVPQLLRKFDLKLAGGLEGREWRTLNRWFVKQQDFMGTVIVRGKEKVGY